MVYPALKQETTIHILGPFPWAAFREQRKLPSLPLPPFAEPSSSVAVRFHLSLKQWFRVQPLAFPEHKDWPG